MSFFSLTIPYCDIFLTVFSKREREKRKLFFIPFFLLLLLLLLFFSSSLFFTMGTKERKNSFLKRVFNHGKENSVCVLGVKKGEKGAVLEKQIENVSVERKRI